MITQEELKEILHYDPITGIFTSLVNRGSKVHKGDTLGSLEPRGYLRIRINYKFYKLHRLAFLYMEGYMPIEVDHKNRIRTDNHWDNLRAATRLENTHNRVTNNSVIGVSWNKEIEKWKAYGIRRDGNTECVHLGCFINYDDAVIVRKMWEYESGYKDL